MYGPSLSQAEAGLLDGRPATTHWALAERYRERYSKVDWKAELFITESDNIFCGGGVYAALDLCLHLVERLAGYEVAKQCGRALLIDAPCTWQSSFSAPLLNQKHYDDKIRRAQEYIHEYFNVRFTMEELAQGSGMSTRNFSRRFRQATGEASITCVHKLRINQAKQLLETDFKTIQDHAAGLFPEHVIYVTEGCHRTLKLLALYFLFGLCRTS